MVVLPTGTAPIELLVVQPTPFCNLDCDYCYLPKRDDRTRMAPATLGRLASHIVAAGWLADDATLVWHAGEPMVPPPDWYEAAITLLGSALPPGTRLTHSFQTNGTLLHNV